MADRVLTENEVDEMGGWVRTFKKLFPTDANKLIASHRLLQRRVEKLEGLLKHVTGEVPR
jgi:hypothetical protein